MALLNKNMASNQTSKLVYHQMYLKIFSINFHQILRVYVTRPNRNFCG